MSPSRRANGSFGAFAIFVLAAGPLRAQHEQHAAVAGSEPSTIAILNAARTGSGTTWLPDAAGMRGVHQAAGDWRLMFDGTVNLQYVRTSGIRAQWQLGSVNWFMAMADRDVAGGVVQLRAMLSAEPATLTDMGYPLLLQVAQPYREGLLTDRQHPHELFSEIALRFARPITRGVGVEIYLAPSGEPALGPVAYRHRPSALSDPMAPLGHHAQDLAHTTFGVITLGVFGARAKLEGSLFNGRHADERRRDLDLGDARLDSRAIRISVNPAAAISISAAYAAFGENADELHPASHDFASRATASLTHVARSGDRVVASSVVYGINVRGGGAGSLPSALIETNLDLGPLSIFGRAEHVRRGADELALTGSVPSDLTVRALSLGLARRIAATARVELRGAVRGTLNILPRELTPFYGGARPIGVTAYISARPVAH